MAAASTQTCGLASSWQAALYTCPNAGVAVMVALWRLVLEAEVAVAVAAVDLLVLVRSRVALALAVKSQRVAVSLESVAADSEVALAKGLDRVPVGSIKAEAVGSASSWQVDMNTCLHAEVVGMGEKGGWALMGDAGAGIGSGGDG